MRAWTADRVAVKSVAVPTEWLEPPLVVPDRADACLVLNSLAVPEPAAEAEKWLWPKGRRRHWLGAMVSPAMSDATLVNILLGPVVDRLGPAAESVLVTWLQSVVSVPAVVCSKIVRRMSVADEWSACPDEAAT